MIGNKREIIKFIADCPEEKKYRVEEYHEKRSVPANDYYWNLENKLADALRTSRDELHNELLGRYGQFEYDKDGKLIVVTVTKETDLSPFGHWKPYKSNGKFQSYIKLKGSQYFDSKEMSILIDGLISECKELGIETMTSDELKRLEGYEVRKDKSV